MRSATRLMTTGATLAIAVTLAPAGSAAPSENAGCIAHVVNFFRPLTHPYGLFVSGHAQADRPFGQGVSAIASDCPR